uniref:V-type proton ATPase subunit E n=1 Tax=Cacopsylla melanoneura TaxID=428564 RepID=A0A8D8ZGN6_9HEMI
MDVAQLKNQARMELMKSKEDSVDSILEEAKNKLADVAQDRTKYAQIMELLLIQGLLALLEPTVTIRCKETDSCLVETILPRVLDAYESITGAPVDLKIDDTNLEPQCAGGVELSAQGGQLYLSNTLESRLDLLAWQARPEIRDILFGRNPNRMFAD